MGDVLNGEFEISFNLVKNQHRICMYKYTWTVAQTHHQQKRRRFVLITGLLFLYVCKCYAD